MEILNHFFLLLVIVVSDLIVNWFSLNQQLKKLLSIYNETKIIILQNIEDDKKQKQILFFSYTVLITSIKILLVMMMIFLLIYIFNKFNNNFIEFIFKITSVIECVLIFLIYFKIKQYAKL